MYASHEGCLVTSRGSRGARERANFRDLLTYGAVVNIVTFINAIGPTGQRSRSLRSGPVDADVAAAASRPRRVTPNEVFLHRIILANSPLIDASMHPATRTGDGRTCSISRHDNNKQLRIIGDPFSAGGCSRDSVHR